MNKQHGMSLVELMIGMVLSLSVIAGVGSLFLNMKKSNQIQRAMATMADDSSYVQEVLQKEIRRTGGLRSRSDSSGAKDRIFLGHNDVLDSSALVSQLNFSASEHIKGDATLPVNDAFAIRYQLLDSNDLGSGTASNGSSPCTQNVLLNTGEDPITHVCLSNVYPLTCGEDPGAEGKEQVVSVYFYLDDNTNTLSCVAQRTKPDNSNLPGATETCVKNCTNPSTTNLTTADVPVELIHNVVKLTLTYGVDDAPLDGAANYYTDAANVSLANKWADVISVRLSVVVRSDENNLTNKIMNYTVDGVPYTPTDHRLYKVFTTTIALRNQLL